MKTAIQAQSTHERSGDDYDQFQQFVLESFDKHDGAPLFTTNSDGLWDAYLEGLPADARQHYNCNACRHFIQRYGGLVVIGSDGVHQSALWRDYGNAPEFFRESVKAMSRIVAMSRVSGVFVSFERTLGTPVTGEWEHLHCVVHRGDIWMNRNVSADQRMAQIRQDYKTVISGVLEYPVDVVEQALKVLSTNSVYRSEKFDEPIRWLYDLQRQRGRMRGVPKDNITWLYVATSPDGFHHIKANVTASLMDDIKAGFEFEEIKARFEANVRPEAYQRSTVAPAQGSIDRANDLIKSLGSVGALYRRYATLEDIREFIWLPQPIKATTEIDQAGPFSHITPRRRKTQEKAVKAVSLPENVMTWAKFVNSVLPTARKIEAKIPAESSRFMALVTATDPYAAPILAWDDPDNRNPVSWYYGAGIDGEFKRRVEGAGGQYENVDIRATLIWSNRNDLDLHCVTPKGEHIFFNSKRATCGGYLDVDMNVRGETTTPVENIRWAYRTAPRGHYRFFVMNYRFHESETRPTAFRVEVQVKDQFFHFEGVIPARSCGSNSAQEIIEFEYTPGQPLSLGNQGQQKNRVADWNVVPGDYVPVTAIVASPNLWGEHPQEHHGKHIFFTLQGCKDTNRANARGFFVESLKQEYREIRSVIDAYNSTAVITGEEASDACGLGMTSGQPWGLVLRVTSDIGVADYKIDRWD